MAELRGPPRRGRGKRHEIGQAGQEIALPFLGIARLE
jgi:hypothetical protein